MQSFGKSESIMPYWTGFGWYASLWIEQACCKWNVDLAICSKCISWLCEMSSQSYVIVFMTMKWGIRLRLILVKTSVSLQQNGVFVHMAGQTCWSLQWQVYIVNNWWILEWKASSFFCKQWEIILEKKVNLVLTVDWPFWHSQPKQWATCKNAHGRWAFAWQVLALHYFSDI